MKGSTITTPILDNQFAADRMLRNALAHQLPSTVFDSAHDRLHEEGGRQQQRYKVRQQANEPEPPGRVRTEDAWGHPIQQTTVPTSWTRARRAMTDHGMVQMAQGQPYGSHSRLVQMALMHLMAPEAPGLAPLIARTDVAVYTLLRTGTAEHVKHLVPRFTSKDPDTAWLCDIWGTSHLLSSPDTDLQAANEDGTWHLHGRVLTHSATYPDAALIVAPDADGTRHLFLLKEPAKASGLRIDTPATSVAHPEAPTATLQLDGVAVEHLTDTVGRRGPAPFLQYIWDAVITVSCMRRALALARGAAETWRVQDKELAYNTLIQETLADMQARYESAFNLTVRCVQALGRMEAEHQDAAEALVPLLAPLAKHHALHQAGHVSARALHIWGQSALRSQTGLTATLDRLRAQTTTNGTPHDMALHLLHVIEHKQQFGSLRTDFKDTLRGLSVETLVPSMKAAVLAFRDANDWIKDARAAGGETLEAGAGRFAYTVGNALSVALMIDHAEWALRTQQDGRPAAAVERFATTPLSRISDLDPHDAYVLTWDFNCPTLFDCHSGTAGDASLKAVDSLLAT